MTKFPSGSIVRARKREWVVLPDSTDELLMLQPLGGTASEISAILLSDGREEVKHATFADPDPSRCGDARSSRLLREAARLGFRSGAGPFRSFGRIAVEPRAYQLVPLLLAMQMETVRLLIADDVGIGKTIETMLVARELLDRDEIRSFAVLCPPHLAEQWQRELREKFHIEAELVLASTAARLERSCAAGESLFEYHPFTIVSLDYIKADRRRDDFLRACPDLVIVDEAHTCAQAAGVARQQRHHLLREISNRDRHIVLVSATPHSGDPNAFRSLLSVLRPEFADLPDDLSGPHNERRRQQLARHLVQRRRANIQDYLQDETPFPVRDDQGGEIAYSFSAEHRALFDRALRYARELVRDESGSKFRQRVRWWSALSLLRAIASSPAAAAATLRARARNIAATSETEADSIGRRNVFDLNDEETLEGSDITPGAVVDEEGEEKNSTSSETRRLQDLAREAEALVDKPQTDKKLEAAHKQIKAMLDANYSPIVFCRFINTAEYVGKFLRDKLRGVQVEVVTGLMSPNDREAAIQQLAEATQDGKRRVLVATDCLSEGVNLQAYFNAVMHYDLSWNPTRHEQREGRVDRFGQRSSVVRTITLFGRDNPIDGIVLEVLLRKHKSIRRALGVSVPVPLESDNVVNAILEGVLLRGKNDLTNEQASLFSPDELPEAQELTRAWDAAQEREKRSITVFSHKGIKAEEVQREADAMRRALGSQNDVKRFVVEALKALDVPFTGSAPSRLELKDLPTAIAEPLRTALPSAIWKKGVLKARFDTTSVADEQLIGRSHPLVSSLAAFLLETALDEQSEYSQSGLTAPAARCGAMRTNAVTTRTHLLLLRVRFHIYQRARGQEDESTLLAEDTLLCAFRGAPDAPQWLTSDEAEALLDAPASGNIAPDQAANFVERVTENLGTLRPDIKMQIDMRSDELLEAHKRVRDATKQGGSVRVEPKLPADVLGVWVLLPPLAQ